MDLKKFEAVIETAKENIGEVFGCVSDDMLEIIEGVIDRLDPEDLEDEDEFVWAVSQAVDDELIWTLCQWQVMMHYQSPDEANYGEAVDLLINQILQLF